MLLRPHQTTQDQNLFPLTSYANVDTCSFPFKILSADYIKQKQKLLNMFDLCGVSLLSYY